jgi:methyl-accepting chemotaxis protein
MTDEDRQCTIDFILEQQAQFAANMEVLREAQARTDKTVQGLATQVEQIAEQLQQNSRQLQQNSRQQQHINEVVAVIADAQQHTDERLNALIDVVRQGQNGKA